MIAAHRVSLLAQRGLIDWKDHDCGGMLFPEYRAGTGWVDVCDACGFIQAPTPERMAEIEKMIREGILEAPA
ncbi:MAG: hypothetical protein LUQ71_10375 [Methanoregula sp.]|nr:hypothetical protein [Methanoregula sp.]